MGRCFECDKSQRLVNHHVVPMSLGGTKTIPLCYRCHARAHNARGVLALMHKNNSKWWTPRKVLTLHQKLKLAGWTMTEIAAELNRRKWYPVHAGVWTARRLSSVVHSRRVRTLGKRAQGANRRFARRNSHTGIAAGRLGLSHDEFRSIYRYTLSLWRRGWRGTRIQLVLEEQRGVRVGISTIRQWAAGRSHVA